MHEMKDIEGDELFLTISSKQLAEIRDYSEGENVELHIVGEVSEYKQVEKQPVKEGEVKTGNRDAEDVGDEYIVTIQVKEAGVMNMKEDRKRAEHLGMTPERLNKIKGKSGMKTDSM